ncbi:MAG: chorismate synthase [Spartobacteria bacterium]|nr:chorismate synthase [Spartobacteria bacterium]
MSSSFGSIFRVTTFGESHGAAVGAVVDGCPPRLALSVEDIQPQLTRRRPGQSKLSTPREEADRVAILSGVENGITLGTPIALMVENKTHRPGDYGEMLHIPRPSHADYTYEVKYGIRASSGGGRASARETIGRVAAGAVAEKFLSARFGIEIVAWVDTISTIKTDRVDEGTITREMVDGHITRCPDESVADQMEQAIMAAREQGDSLGGVVTCVCRNVPAGLGEPVFRKLDAELARAMLSIPASKGFEIGSGFAGAGMSGSEHNDPFILLDNGQLGTMTNNSGGIQGGISNGELIRFRVAFKPVATIGRAQETVDFNGQSVTLEAKGRHDPCVLPRVIPVVESMAALALADMALIQQTRF